MRRPERPSLRFYTWLLAVLVLASIALLSRALMDRVDSLAHSADAQARAAAAQELGDSLARLFRDLERSGDQLAVWGETRQQFRRASYYQYWKDQRARARHGGGELLVGVELYRADGTPLGEPAVPVMPALLGDQPVGFRLTADSDGQVMLVYVRAVKDSSPVPLTLGYIATAAALVEGVLQTHRFRDIEADSVRVDLSESIRVTGASDVLPLLAYRLAGNPAFERALGILHSAMWEFGLMAAALLLLSVYLLVGLGGLPLARLSRYIDRLGRDSVGAAYTPKGLLPLAEFDKVLGSLVDFQRRLAAGDRALRDSETRLRAILHNVVDGILTLDANGRVLSANRAAGHLFGRTLDSLTGWDVCQLFDDLSPHTFQRLAAQLDADDDHRASRRIELRGVRGDDMPFAAELTLSQLSLPDVPGFIAVIEDISERKEAEQRLKYMANYDALTGLPNRALLRDRLEHAMRQAERSERLVGVLFMDLDRFKTINDTLGHHAGDQLLKVIGERLRTCVRSGDTVARLGGDEFMVVVENMRHVDEAIRVADKICGSFQNPVLLEGREVFVTPSIGITLYPLDDSTADALLRNADSAMYRAKAMGGDGVQFFTHSLSEQAGERLALENALRQALSRDEFRLHYQPRVCTSDRSIPAVEALLRWHHPELGEVTPDRFIPILEETGQIEAVGAWVLRQACMQNAAWRRSGRPPMRVAVNISARQIRSRALIALVDAALADSGLPADGLELEITESAMIENIDETADALRQLAARGVRIALDDFGTGYSALGYLRKLPIHTLKVDRSFIRDVPGNVDDGRVVSALIAIARSMDMEVTAEGVETPEQLDFLVAHDCREVQGFLFARPLASEALEAWLDGHAGQQGLRA